MLLHNGLILSVAATGSVDRSNWMKVSKDGKVEKIGQGQPPAELKDGVEVKDLEQRVVFPGLADSHVHVYSMGCQLRDANLGGCKSIDELKQSLRKHFEEWDKSGLPVLMGSGWDQELLGRDPTRQDLDEVVGERPCIIYRRCYHVVTVSTKTLEMCGAMQDPPNVEGGVVEKDADGVPTGVLREAAIQEVLKPVLDKELPEEMQRRAVIEGLNECVKRGITQVQTNDGKQLGNISKPWAMYTQLAKEGKLPCRIFLTLPYKEVGPDFELTKPTEDESGLVSSHRVKLWTDGALGARTAALNEPYSDDELGQNVGVLQLSPEEIFNAVAGAVANGWRIEAHTIGDRSAKHLIEAFEKYGLYRPLLTHCQILNANLVERMAKSGIVANVQPQFVPSDKDIAPSRLGRETERFRFSYPWKTLLEKGVRLAGGSDSPVELPAPLVGMADALDHVLHDGAEDHPDERLSFGQALEMYTAGAAYAAGVEDKLGRLEPGMQADFVLLDLKDGKGEAWLPDSSALRTAGVLEVYVQGRLTHRNSMSDLSGDIPPPQPHPGAAGKNGLMFNLRRGRCPCCS